MDSVKLHWLLVQRLGYMMRIARLAALLFITQKVQSALFSSYIVWLNIYKLSGYWLFLTKFSSTSVVLVGWIICFCTTVVGSWKGQVWRDFPESTARQWQASWGQSQTGEWAGSGPSFSTAKCLLQDQPKACWGRTRLLWKFHQVFYQWQYFFQNDFLMHLKFI